MRACACVPAVLPRLGARAPAPPLAPALSPALRSLALPPLLDAHRATVARKLFALDPSHSSSLSIFVRNPFSKLHGAWLSVPMS